MLSAAEIEKLRYKNLELATSLIARAALEKGLNVEVLPYKLLRLSQGEHFHYVLGRSLSCNSVTGRAIANNKYLTRHILRRANIPTPNSLLLRNPAAWRQVLNSSRLQFPLVVKPLAGSHGLGATMNIRSAGTLHRAVNRAFSYMRKKEEENRVLVEEYFEGGHDLRLLVLNGKVISVVERDPAYVEGDGVSTIRELINRFNSEWKSKIEYDLPLCPIPIDAEVTRCLKSQQLSLESIPKPQEKIYVRWNANASMGGRAIEITDQVNDSIKNLAIKCAHLVGLKVAGVDVLARDFRKDDVSHDNVTVLEVNHAPGFDINQLPFQGKGKNVAGAIVDFLFTTEKS